ncbi:MAG: hypothetical protein JNM70_19465 [Anaerolineae bacterium]|nr:hypothetical protein [Anaerolineae bacterium]
MAAPVAVCCQGSHLLLRTFLGDCGHMANPTSTSGILVPEDFDHVSYDSINTRIASSHNQPSVEWHQFVAAWKAVLFRYRECTEHSETFIHAIRAEHTFENKYVQDRELFGFFVSGLSAIESFHYALFAVGTLLRGNGDFRIVNEKERRLINPELTAEKYQAIFPAENLTQLMNELVHSSEYANWSSIRNFLIHRAAFSRTVFLNVNAGTQYQPPQQEIRQGLIIVFEENTTAARRKWLSDTLNLLIAETSRFVDVHFT